MSGTRDQKVGEALAKLDHLLDNTFAGLNGGTRVRAREILEALYDAGKVDGAWDPRDSSPVAACGEPPVAPRSASEHLGAIRGRRAIPEVTEGQGEPPEVSALRGWWEQTAHDEVAQLVSKMVEYGGLSRATDLTEIGRHLTEVGVSSGPLTGGGAVQEGWLQELGIYFYLVGKFARWSAAIQEGRPVSDDTLLDIGIYVRMAQRVRAVGGWPV